MLGENTPEALEFGRKVHRDRKDRISYGEKAFYSGEKHCLIVGANGSGKGTKILLPNLLRMHGSRSVVVVDPKGELAAVSAPFRRRVGRTVILNPFGVLLDRQGFADMESTGFNPLLTIDPRARDFNVKASQLAEAMITTDSKQPHFTNSARALLAAIIMYVVVKAFETRTLPTMRAVRQLLCLASEPPNKFMPGDEGKGIPKLAQEMMRSTIEGLRNKAAQFTDWNREIQSVASTAKIQTECFDDPEIADDLAKRGFDFRELKRQPTTCFLVVPPDMLERHGKWLRVALTAALQASMRHREAGEPGIMFMLDEFAALGHMQIVESVWSVVRGYGIQMMPILHDLSQLKSLYKERWETYIGNAGATAFFAPNDLTTADWLSKRLGETTRMMHSRSETSGKATISTTPVKVPYMTPHQLHGLPAGHMMLIMAGLSHGSEIYAPPYYRIQERNARARVNPYVHPVPRRLDLPPPANANGGFWLQTPGTGLQRRS